jgi:uncharacterized protein (TIGR02118 family)
MVKLVFVLYLQQGRDHVEMSRYWREVHTPLTAKVPGVKRYVINHAIESLEASDPAFFGYGELWFESKEDFQKATATPEWETSIADAQTFLDLERTLASSAYVEEHVIV